VTLEGGGHFIIRSMPEEFARELWACLKP